MTGICWKLESLTRLQLLQMEARICWKIENYNFTILSEEFDASMLCVLQLYEVGVGHLFARMFSICSGMFLELLVRNYLRLS